MAQRLLTSLFVFFLVQCLLISNATADSVDTSSTTGPSKKKPETTFLNGLACLKKSDLPCAQLAVASIPSQSPYSKLLAGDIAATTGDFDQTMLLLLPLQAQTSLLPQATASLHASLALAYDNQPDPLRALEQRTLTETSLTETTDIAANQQQIWQSISTLPKDQLIEMRGESPDTTIQGWIDLALAAQNSAQKPSAINDWRSMYPDHPATTSLVNQLIAQTNNTAQIANSSKNSGINSSALLTGPIALLLPFQAEAFYPAADAIERGFVAAQSQANNNAEIKIYATHGNKDEIAALYQQAINEGAHYVLGPLTRDEFSELASDAAKNTLKIAVPTLGLNQPDTTSTASNLYSFGLSVDAEVAQIVKMARDYGMQTAIVVASDTTLAAKMANSFSTAWTNEGGQIKLQVGVPPNADLSDIKLQINAHPADMILIAASADEARTIRPYLDAATPTFGLSHIYAGVAHDSQDSSLSAVRFVDMPWLLNPDDPSFTTYKTASADLPQGEMQRWFALGVDAYQLLVTLTSSPNQAATLHGLTGKIHISETGEISRELSLGRFTTDGIVVEKTP